MKNIVIGLLVVSSTVFGATNYFTGATNGRLNLDSNWSLGVITDGDDLVLTADSWGMQSGLNAFEVIKPTSITVNSNVNDIALATLQLIAQDASAIWAKKVTIDEAVTKDVKLGGVGTGLWYVPTGGAAYTGEIFHYGSGTLLQYAKWGEHYNNPGSLKIAGNNTNLVTIGTASTYTGSTALDNIHVRLAVAATATTGPLGNGGDIVLQNGAVLELFSGSSLSNSSITVSSGTVFDASGLASYSYDGTIAGKGTLKGDYLLSGILRPGPGTGTLTFEDNLTVMNASKVSFEIFTNSVDVVANDGGDTLTVVDGSEWVFDFSYLTGSALFNGASFVVLDGWSTIAGSSTNITVTGVDEDYGVDVSELFTTGEITIVLESFEIGDVDISIDSSNAIISWEGLNGVAYALQRSQNLLSNDWQIVGSVTSSLEGVVFATNALDKAAAFYRVISE